jgi:hypothetical protein
MTPASIVGRRARILAVDRYGMAINVSDFGTVKALDGDMAVVDFGGWTSRLPLSFLAVRPAGDVEDLPPREAWERRKRERAAKGAARP